MTDWNEDQAMNLEDLGRRAVACKHWRWMPGMYIRPLEFRVVWFDDFAVGECDQISYRWERIPDAYPDLSDPATIGCLLALVRDARRDPGYGPSCLDAIEGDWVVERPSFARQTRYASEAEALVVALEAAP